MAKPEQLLQIEPDTELKFRGKNEKFNKKFRWMYGAKIKRYDDTGKKLLSSNGHQNGSPPKYFFAILTNATWFREKVSCSNWFRKHFWMLHFFSDESWWNVGGKEQKPDICDVLRLMHISLNVFVWVGISANFTPKCNFHFWSMGKMFRISQLKRVTYLYLKIVCPIQFFGKYFRVVS